MNNNNTILPIRIVCINGKHKVYYAQLDDEGNVDRLLDEVELVGDDNTSQFMALLTAIYDAKKFPIVVVNAGNKKMLMGGY